MKITTHYAKRGLALSAAAALTLGIAACTDDAADGDILTVCTSIPFDPFEMEEDGEVVGFDAAMMELLADRRDQELEWNDVDFDAISSGSALNTGQCDIAAAALTITETREENMGMSDGYFRADQALVIPEDSDISTLEDLEGLEVAVQAGSTGEEFASSIEDEHGFTPVAHRDMGNVQAALSSGGADASLADVSAWGSMIDRGDLDLEIIEVIETEEYYGFAVALDNTELLEEANAMLEEAFEDGTYADIYEEWIGEPFEGDEGFGSVDPIDDTDDEDADDEDDAEEDDADDSDE